MMLLRIPCQHLLLRGRGTLPLQGGGVFPFRLDQVQDGVLRQTARLGLRQSMQLPDGFLGDIGFVDKTARGGISPDFSQRHDKTDVFGDPWIRLAQPLNHLAVSMQTEQRIRACVPEPSPKVIRIPVRLAKLRHLPLKQATFPRCPHRAQAHVDVGIAEVHHQNRPRPAITAFRQLPGGKPSAAERVYRDGVKRQLFHPHRRSHHAEPRDIRRKHEIHAIGFPEQERLNPPGIHNLHRFLLARNIRQMKNIQAVTQLFRLAPGGSTRILPHPAGAQFQNRHCRAHPRRERTPAIGRQFAQHGIGLVTHCRSDLLDVEPRFFGDTRVLPQRQGNRGARTPGSLRNIADRRHKQWQMREAHAAWRQTQAAGESKINREGKRVNPHADWQQRPARITLTVMRTFTILLSRRIAKIILSISVVLLVYTAVGAEDPSPPRPNFIFVMADDYGIDQVACYGSDRYETPNIDSLAEQGIRFTNAYCQPNCGTTRRTFFTSQYVFQHGDMRRLHRGRPEYTPETMPHIGQMLRDAGYQVGAFGKVGEGGNDAYDEIFDTDNGKAYWRTSLSHNGQKITYDEPVYSQDEIQKYAFAFMEANQDVPFFVYYSLNLPHVPIDPTPTTAEGATAEEINDDMNRYIDKYVGELMTKLDELGIADKTVLIFTGDNGTANGASTIQGGRRIMGGKGSLLVGGSNVPLIIRWPENIAPGRVEDDLTDFTDFLPTFAYLAGAEMPTQFPIHGQNMAGLWLGQPYEKREYIFVQTNIEWFIRGEDYWLTHDGRFFETRLLPFEMPELDVENLTPKQQAAYDRLDHIMNQELKPAQGTIAQFALDEMAAEEGPNPYLDFKIANWPYGHRHDIYTADWADPDEDGWPNLFEMAFETDPTVKDARPSLALAPGKLITPYPPVKSPYVEVQVELSENLSADSWQPVSEFVEVTTPDDASGSGFLRLRAKRTQHLWPSN